MRCTIASMVLRINFFSKLLKFKDFAELLMDFSSLIKYLSQEMGVFESYLEETLSLTRHLDINLLQSKFEVHPRPDFSPHKMYGENVPIKVYNLIATDGYHIRDAVVYSYEPNNDGKIFVSTTNHFLRRVSDDEQSRDYADLLQRTDDRFLYEENQELHQEKDNTERLFEKIYWNK